MPDVQLYTKDEAADILNISVRKLDDLRSKGKLRWVPIGTAVRIRSDDLEEFIEDHTRENGRRFVL